MFYQTLKFNSLNDTGNEVNINSRVLEDPGWWLVEVQDCSSYIIAIDPTAYTSTLQNPGSQLYRDTWALKSFILLDLNGGAMEMKSNLKALAPLSDSPSFGTSEMEMTMAKLEAKAGTHATVDLKPTFAPPLMINTDSTSSFFCGSSFNFVIKGTNPIELSNYAFFKLEIPINEPLISNRSHFKTSQGVYAASSGLSLLIKYTKVFPSNLRYLV